MGKKGAKLSDGAVGRAEELVAALSDLGGITSRKMFGGLGIFSEGSMFGIVDSSGSFFLKVGDGNRDRFEAAGSERHGKMPYYSVPAEVEANPDTLREWAATSVAEAKR